MRTIIGVVLIFLVFQKGHSQKTIYLDVNGKKISKNEYQKKWIDQELFLTRWDSIGKNGKRYATLKNNLYQRGVFNHNTIIQQLQKITGKKIQDSLIIILEFYYKDDLCNLVWDNKWTKSDIKERKSFIIPIKDYLASKNILFFSLFEDDIDLKNKPNDKNEFFYSDLNNFFRSELFIEPTLCGSHAIIKPNGEILIKNGENRADFMSGHLKPEIWNRFFNEDESN